MEPIATTYDEFGGVSYDTHNTLAGMIWNALPLNAQQWTEVAVPFELARAIAIYVRENPTLFLS